MAEASNAVLEERIKQLNEDFNYFRKSTRQELKDMEVKLDSTSRVAEEVRRSIQYVEKTVTKMDDVMTNFIALVGQQNDKMDEFTSAQNRKMDDFVNSDKRMSHKKQLIVSTLQVLAGILGTLATLWVSGRV